MKNRPDPVLILVFGVLSLWMCGFFLGIPGWIMGNRALEDPQMYPSAELCIVKAGRILSIVGTCVTLTSFCLYFMVGAVVGPAARSRSPYGMVSSIAPTASLDVSSSLSVTLQK